MLAMAGQLPPSASGAWAYELKWDGMRALATVQPGGGLALVTRTGADATARFPEIARLDGLGPPEGSVLDGEIVVLDDAGRPSFAALAPRISARHGAAPGRPAAAPRAATFVVFDVLRRGAAPVLQLPYDDRRALLQDLLVPSSRVVVGESFDDGEALLAATAEAGLEGVVAKRRTSAYRPGVRSGDWVKVPHRGTASYVVGGWKTRRSAPGRLASLLVGTPVGDGLLRYDGAVGSGLDGATASVLAEVLGDLELAEHPFDEAPVPAADDVLRWAEPVLVVDVAHLGRSGQGLLRQPAFVRARPDLSVSDLLAEGLVP